MDEIQHKYVINRFKERSNKQKAVKFEEIDLEVYKPTKRKSESYIGYELSNFVTMNHLKMIKISL